MPARSSVDISALRTAVCDAASAFDAGALTPNGADVAMRHWSAIAHAASAALALAAARVAACGAPSPAGVRTPEEHVAATTGTSTNKARQAINAGTRLGAAQATREQATAGNLSPDQAAWIADAVGANPAAEADLLAVAASGSIGELQAACARAKASAIDLEQRERHIHRQRRLSRYRDREGVEHLHMAGPRIALAAVDRA